MSAVRAQSAGGIMQGNSERSHRGVGFDLEAALLDPTRRFSDPAEIRFYPWLTIAEKMALLRVWAQQLEAQAKSSADVHLEQPSGVYNRIRQELHALQTLP
jgi:hypothetical protein